MAGREVLEVLADAVLAGIELSEATDKGRPGRRWLRAVLWRLFWAAAAVSILAALIFWLAA